MRKLVSKSVVVWVVVLFVLAVFPLRAEEQQKEDAAEYISVDLKDVNLGDALSMIAKRCGVSIIVNSKREFPVTANLKDVHFEQALELLSKSAGIGFRVIGKTYYFDYPLELREKFDVGLSKVCRLQFADAIDVKCLLEEVLGSEKGSFSITSNSSGNSVIISGSPGMIGSAMELIEEIDIPHHRLSIAVELVEIPGSTGNKQSETLLTRVEGVITNGAKLKLAIDDHIPSDVTREGKTVYKNPSLMFRIVGRINDDGLISLDIFGICRIVAKGDERTDRKRDIETEIYCREGKAMEIGRFFDTYSQVTYVIRITPKIVK